MKSSKSFIRYITLSGILFIVSCMSIMAQVTASVVVLPPYSPDIEDYADKTRITVLARDYNDISCNLRITVTGDNGVVLTTNDDHSYSTFTLQNGIPVTLTGPDLSEYFDLNNLFVTGIDPAELQTEGLPAGNYQVCAVVYYDGVPISEAAPSGCSNYFRVNYLQPPILISPSNESIIENTFTQQIIFSWTPSPGAPSWATYTLKIVEINDPGQDPQDAMLSATTPSFFEEQVSGTSFLYGPGQPTLDPGKRYAFQVIASDAETKSKFENFGRSETFWFQYGTESENIFSLVDVTEIQEFTKKPSLPSSKSWVVSNTSMSGTMQYLFPQDQGRKGFLNYIPMKLQIGYYFLTNSNEKVYLVNSLLDYQCKQTISMGYGTYTVKYNADYATDTLPEIDSDLSFTTTGPDGEFIFMFNNPGLGLVAKNIVATRTQIGITMDGFNDGSGKPNYHKDESIETFTGDLYMFARLIVDSPYYTSPDQDFIVEKGEHSNVGVIDVNVRSYDLKVNVKADKNYQNQYKQDNIEYMVVYLLRATRPDDVPGNEGKGSQPVEPNEKMLGMTVLAKEITNNSGIALFKDLVKNIYTDYNDRYYLYATALESSEVNYTMDAAVEYHFLYYADEAVFNSEYKLPSPVEEKVIIARPLPPAVKGSVYRYDDQMKPVSGAIVRLYNYPQFYIDQVTAYNGKFNFVLTDAQAALKLKIRVTCPGFKTKIVDVPFTLMLGKKFVREDILLEPESTITGTIINEQGEGIAVLMRMDDGAYKPFQPFCMDFSVYTPLIETGDQNPNIPNPQMQTNAPQVVLNVLPGNSGGGNPTPSNTVVNVYAQSSGQNNLTQTNNAGKFVTNKSDLKVAIEPPCTTPTAFTLYCTTGNHKLIIDPVDPKYLNDTIPVSVIKGKNTHEPITVYTNKHRVLVVVRKKNLSGSVSVGTPLGNAKVTIDNVGTDYTNSVGEVRFEFEGAGDTVTIHVEGPQGGDYVSQIKTALVKESKNYTMVPVNLKPAGRIKGTVYAGTSDSSAVAQARVYADIPGEIKIETTTDSYGRYDLRNVPLNAKMIIRAVKSASNYVGDSVKIQIASPNVLLENINFHLSVFNDMDISKLLGFPIEVTRLTTGGAGGEEVSISGNFLNIPANNYFKVLDSETNPRFNNIVIVPSQYLKNEKGIPLSQPKNSKVPTNKNKLGVQLYKNYTADLTGDKVLGLEVVDLDKGIGAINGRIEFNVNSFTTPLVTFNEQVYLSSQGDAGSLLLTAFTNDPVYINYPTGLHLSDNSGGPLSFTFDNLLLEANPLSSAINGDSLYLSAVLHTKFKHVPYPDANLALGKLIFIKDASQQVSFKDVYGHNLTLQLSESSVPWSLHVNSWIFGKNTGLLFKNGYVNTGMVTVPFTDIYVEQSQDSTRLKGGNFQLDQLSLGNIVTLNITGQKQFGYDVGRNAWKLSVSGQPGQPCASFGGLPGMAAGDKVEIENFFFLSTSNPVFNIYQGTKPLTLYNVGSFFPGLITVINNEIGIAGMIDYKIPYMNSGNNLDYKIFYFKDENGKIAFRNEVAKFLITPPGAVTMEFFQVSGTQTLDGNGFVAKGKVYELIGANKLFEFDAWLYRTVDSTSLIVDKTSNQIFRFSGSTGPRLENISGRMAVNAGNWSPLHFGGELKNANGASGSLSFTVMGDLVANEQNIAVTNIPAPFNGIMNMTYDFDNKRFTGIIDFGQALPGGASFSANAEVLFDPGGWYFLGLGSISLPTPSMGGQASIFIGSYKVNQHIIDKFIPNSRVYQLFGEPPANFPALNQQFKGFYIEGGAQIPIPILPQFEFNLGLISAQLNHEVGADIRLGMNFAQSNTFSAGVSVFGRITAGLGASMGLVCASSTVTGKGLISADGMYSTNGSWSATGYVEFGISGTTELGFGACDSDCDGILGVGPCVVDSESAGIDLFGKFTISDSGTDFEFGFK